MMPAQRTFDFAGLKDRPAKHIRQIKRLEACSHPSRLKSKKSLRPKLHSILLLANGFHILSSKLAVGYLHHFQVFNLDYQRVAGSALLFRPGIAVRHEAKEPPKLVQVVEETHAIRISSSFVLNRS